MTDAAYMQQRHKESKVLREILRLEIAKRIVEPFIRSAGHSRKTCPCRSGKKGIDEGLQA
jgi:hypothetical protein